MSIVPVPLFWQREVADLKEMCRVMKKERAEAEKKLSHLRGVGPRLEPHLTLYSKTMRWKHIQSVMFPSTHNI